MIEERLKKAIRDVADFPKPGIIFKDITPILKDPQLCEEVIGAFMEYFENLKLDIDAVAGIESRGFLFGMMLAYRLRVPFVPVRKQGRLPYHTISQTYDLEYGTATIEVHKDAVVPGTRVLIHDDLLATGGTVEACTRLFQSMGARIAGYAFLISLDYLEGKKRIEPFSKNVVTLATY
ncbi:adenine phosphoribosyltransferase [bacterium A37T11]|nr:adenine phosphoribosyltransferase [bacterium A37T11]